MSRALSIKESMTRRYHSDVRKLKEKCKELGINLYPYCEAEDYYYCILSDNEYEIGEIKTHCSIDNENYFVCADDYFILQDES